MTETGGHIRGSIAQREAFSQTRLNLAPRVLAMRTLGGYLIALRLRFFIYKTG